MCFLPIKAIAKHVQTRMNAVDEIECPQKL